MNASNVILFQAYGGTGFFMRIKRLLFDLLVMVVVSICYCSGEYNVVFYIAYDACTDQKLILTP
jgi:hypothetical protein